MNIVFEGPDNVGKSTLIEKLTTKIRWPVIASEGPEKYPGEIDARIMMYRQHRDQCIFDRHPAVSEAMYCFLRDNAKGPSPSSLDLFYRDHNLFIYCRPPVGRDPMADHTINPEVDTPEHLEGVRNNYALLLGRYDEWALQHAHFLYRIGDDSDQLITAIEGVLYGY